MKRVLPPVLLLLMAAGAALWLFPRITMKQLTIVTVPRGAVFYINGVPGGLTPAVRLVPSDGLHLSAARDGFFPRDTLLEATPDTVFLQLTQGCLLVVNTIPTDCHIEAGNSPEAPPVPLSSVRATRSRSPPGALWGSPSQGRSMCFPRM